MKNKSMFTLFCAIINKNTPQNPNVLETGSIKMVTGKKHNECVALGALHLISQMKHIAQSSPSQSSSIVL